MTSFCKLGAFTSTDFANSIFRILDGNKFKIKHCPILLTCIIKASLRILIEGHWLNAGLFFFYTNTTWIHSINHKIAIISCFSSRSLSSPWMNWYFGFSITPTQSYFIGLDTHFLNGNCIASYPALRFFMFCCGRSRQDSSLALRFGNRMCGRQKYHPSCWYRSSSHYTSSRTKNWSISILLWLYPR